MKDHRPVTKVKVLKTAQKGTRWNIWDTDVINGSTQPHGPEPWNGFATQQAARDWVKEQNSNDYFRKLQVVK